MVLGDFVSHSSIGLILRVFSTTSDGVKGRVTNVCELVKTARAICIGNKPVFTRIDVLVFADTRFGTRADCGKTACALRRELIGDVLVSIHEVHHGDLYCGLLNYGIAHQMREGVDYSMVASTEAQSYFTAQAIEAMLNAMAHGAKAAGVAINELTDSIMAGRLANTLAIWNNLALITVGGFDLRAAMSVDNSTSRWICSSSNGEFTRYAVEGVEEVIPLARLVDLYGPCIAPIRPIGSGIQQYEVSDAQNSATVVRRQIAKMNGKSCRQAALLCDAGFTLSFLEGGVMDGYRDKP